MFSYACGTPAAAAARRSHPRAGAAARPPFAAALPDARAVTKLRRGASPFSSVPNARAYVEQPQDVSIVSLPSLDDVGRLWPESLISVRWSTPRAALCAAVTYFRRDRQKIVADNMAYCAWGGNSRHEVDRSAAPWRWAIAPRYRAEHQLALRCNDALAYRG